MKNKELKKLSRQELLEMLIEQTKRADELQEKLSFLEEQIQSRELTINNAGSLAEAGLRINKVFEAADNAVAQYIESVKKLGGDAYMPPVPKADTNETLEGILGEFTKRNQPKPPKHTFAPQKHEEAETPADKIKAPSAKVREIKHLKN